MAFQSLAKFHVSMKEYAQVNALLEICFPEGRESVFLNVEKDTSQKDMYYSVKMDDLIHQNSLLVFEHVFRIALRKRLYIYRAFFA